MATRPDERIARAHDHVPILDPEPADETALAVKSLGKALAPIERHAMASGGFPDKTAPCVQNISPGVRAAIVMPNANSEIEKTQ